MYSVHVVIAYSIFGSFIECFDYLQTIFVCFHFFCGGKFLPFRMDFNFHFKEISNFLKSFKNSTKNFLDYFRVSCFTLEYFSLHFLKIRTFFFYIITIYSFQNKEINILFEYDKILRPQVLKVVSILFLTAKKSRTELFLACRPVSLVSFYVEFLQSLFYFLDFVTSEEYRVLTLWNVPQFGLLSWPLRFRFRLCIADRRIKEVLLCSFVVSHQMSYDFSMFHLVINFDHSIKGVSARLFHC